MVRLGVFNMSGMFFFLSSKNDDTYRYMICVYALSHDVASVFRDRMLASASGSLT